MPADWPFTDPENLTVMTLKRIVRGVTPIPRVPHEEDDHLPRQRQELRRPVTRRRVPTPGHNAPPVPDRGAADRCDPRPAAATAGWRWGVGRGSGRVPGGRGDSAGPLHQGDDFPALLRLWPDNRGRFPTDADSAEPLRARQPLLAE
jgi:hypothetical protein